MKVGFIGLGKLGLPLACILANAGNKILCLDKNEYTLDILKNNDLPFFEPGLNALLGDANENITGFISSYKEMVEETEAAVILVNTQLGDHGYSSDFVESAISDIAVNLKYSPKEYFTIILSSTVLPGTIVKTLIPLAERISGREYKKGFGFSYVPDFVKLGNVIHDFTHPEFFLVGANHKKDLQTTQEIFSNVHRNLCPEYNLTLEEAEIAKTALNAYLVNKITFANFLGRLCSKMENVNVHNITEAIGNDKRISPHFFNSGTPYGGACFPRDVSAFVKFAKDKGKKAKHLFFAEEVNEMVYRDILNQTEGFDKVGIIGVSFKPDSPVTIGSPSVKLIDELKSKNKTIYIFDPLKETYLNLERDVNICESAQECIDKTQAVILMHPSKDLSSLNYKNNHVIDLWGVVK